MIKKTEEVKCPETFEKFISKKEIDQMILSMAASIDESYLPGEEILCVGVLKGAWVTLADLVRQIKRPVQVDFIRARSYGMEKESSGEVVIEKALEVDVTGKHVLLVEEIVDTGRTLSKLKDYVENSGAKSVKIAALLDKKCRRVIPCQVDFLGREIEDHFVVGYGLDWGEKYRDLEEIYIVPS